MIPPDGDFMTHAHRLNTVHLGEGLGWATIVMGGLSAFGSLWKLMGTMTPGDLQPWVILISGVVIAGVGVGVTVYHRIQKAMLDGQSMAAIYAANNVAISQGKPVPWPAYLPPPPELPSNTIVVSPKTGPDPEAPK